MPLRDHFRPPVDNIASWEELHGQWPAVIVQHLHKQLPLDLEQSYEQACHNLWIT